MHGLLFAFITAATTLTPGITVRGTVRGAEIHPFRLNLPAGFFVTGAVAEGEADLRVTVLAPDGNVVGTYDGRARGSEFVSFKTGAGGVYRIEIRAVTAPARPARFTLRFEVPRPEGDGDDNRIEAERLATDAKQLAAKGDPESLRRALANRTRAHLLLHNLGDRPAELAMLDETGLTHYALSEFAEAAAAFNEALELSSQLSDRRGEVDELNNLGANAWMDGRIPEAIARLRQAVELSHRIRYTYAEAGACSNLGILLWQAGELEESRRQSERAFTLVKALGDRQGEGFVRNSLGNALESLGELDAALQQVSRAAQLFRQAGDRPSEGAELVRQARVQLALGRRAGALDNVERGLSLIRDTPDRLSYADALEQLGRVRAAMDDRPRAREAFDAALEIYGQIGSRKGQSEAHHDLGLMHLTSGDAEAARAEFEQARSLRHDFPSLEAETLLQIAATYRLSGDLDNERQYAEVALGIAERLRAGVFERELRTSFSSAMQRYSAELVDVLVRMHHRRPDGGFAERALESAERARALELTAILKRSPAALGAAAGAAVADRLRAVDQQIDFWSWRRWQQADRPAPGGNSDAETSARIEGLLREREKLEADQMRADPQSAALFQSAPIQLETIQREILDDRTILIEFALGERQSFVWAVTTDAVTVATLPPRADVERISRRLFRLVSAGVTATDDKRAVQRDREAAVLARMVLAPIASTLGRRRLLIVADGALHYVPFAALPTPGRSNPLAADHEIVMLPSATTLVLLRRHLSDRRPWTNLVAVLADPVYGMADSRVKQPSTVERTPVAGDRSRPFSRLPHSYEELQAVAAAAPPGQSRTFADFDASRATATGSIVGSSRYVHFATHAIEDDVHPELSAIVLSLVDEKGRAQDGFLRAHDVFRLSLSASIVSLSSCRTAVGKEAGGEGLRSLAASFFHAGAARVLATLWAVDDEGTAIFMGRFYDALLGPEKMSAAAALSRAQRAMRADPRWQDPYYWSGFVLQGDW